MTYRYIYMIVCMAGSMKYKYYIGQHTTTNLNDNYKGSGKLLLDYYKKYPNDYIKTIICFCESIEELNQREHEIIHPLLDDPMCLNIQEGGYHCEFTEEMRNKMSKSLKGKKAWNKGLKMSEEYCIKNKEAHLGHLPWNTGLNKSGFSGKHHSEETKAKVSSKLKGRVVSEETRKKLSESHKGHAAWNKGIKISTL